MSVVDNGKGERKVCDLCGQTIEPMIEGSPISVWSNPYHCFETCDLCSPCRNRLPHGLSLLLHNQALSSETQTALFQALKRTREDGTYRCNFNNEFALFVSSPDPELIKVKGPKKLAEAVLEAMWAKRLVYQVFQNGRGLLASDVEEIINKYFPSGIIEDGKDGRRAVRVKSRKNHVIINGCPIKKDILHTIFLIASDACEDHIDNEEVREALDCILAASPPEEDSE